MLCGSCIIQVSPTTTKDNDMTAAMTKTELAQIAAAAGIPDLHVHGAPAKFCRLLGIPVKQFAGVRSVIKNGGMVPSAAAEAAWSLASGLKDGSITPDGSTNRARENVPVDPEAEMSDEELLTDINKRFRFMRRFVDFALKGKFTSVLITGPGGIGKTFPVERMLDDAEEDGRSIWRVSGSMSAVKLVEALYFTQKKGDVLLIDDADAGFANVEFLNVLKAATDTKGRRVVSWLKQNKRLEEAGVESQFEYNGSVVIISNANMKEKAEKGNRHIDAILSRAMHIDLGVNSSRSLALRVAYMIQEENMFAQLFAASDLSDLHDQAKGEIGEFIKQNRDAFRSLTLREAAKVAKMYIACEGDPEWHEMVLLSLGKL